MLSVVHRAAAAVRLAPSARFLAAALAVKGTSKMPPKEAPKEKVLLGRPSNNLKIGIVGMPNVGYDDRKR